MNLQVTPKIEKKAAKRVRTKKRDDLFGSPKLGSLLEFSQQMLSSKTLGELLADIVRYSVELLNVSFSQLYTLEPEGYFAFRIGYPSPEKNQPLNPDLLKEIRARGYFQKTVINELPTILSVDLTFFGLTKPLKDDKEIKTLVLLPMRVEGKPVGILLLGENEKPLSSSMKGEAMGIALLIANQAASAIHRTRLSSEISEQQMQTVLALAKTVETRDMSIGGHCERMAALAEQTAYRMKCNDDEKRIIRWAALLHDIGKIGISDEILLKPNSLSKQEWSIVQSHSELGAKIVVKISNLAEVAELIEAHHERYDGSGYPKGLIGEQIPLGARILAIVDAYGAITDGRIYQKPRSHANAMQEIMNYAGSYYDPMVVKEFVGLFK